MEQERIEKVLLGVKECYEIGKNACVDCPYKSEYECDIVLEKDVAGVLPWLVEENEKLRTKIQAMNAWLENEIKEQADKIRRLTAYNQTIAGIYPDTEDQPCPPPPKGEDIRQHILERIQKTEKPPQGVKPYYVAAWQRIGVLIDGIRRQYESGTGDANLARRWAEEITWQCAILDSMKEGENG